MTSDFPVLSAGPTPHTPLAEWDFSNVGEVGKPRRWTWDEFRALPSDDVTVDIHCVTKWSNLDTAWQRVSVDTLLDEIETSAEYVVQCCDPGYTTKVSLEDLTGARPGSRSRADRARARRPGAHARPHLYFWKSAKWVRGLQLQATDHPGFRETNGYHNYGDPWREQRYWGD